MISDKNPINSNENKAINEIIELLFFAYRSFTSEPDRILEEIGFGRAHHRVLYFVARNPGISVAELLEILLITKQSLGPVLKELIDNKYIIQKIDDKDRRRRLLHLTEKGENFLIELLNIQMAKIEKSIKNYDEETIGKFKQILFNLSK